MKECNRNKMENIITIHEKKGTNDMKRIGLLTSGGDCQALNAAMRGVVKGLSENADELEVYGFLNPISPVFVLIEKRQIAFTGLFDIF